jgi:hypothetical protein
MGFAMAHQGDKALMERFAQIMMKLDPGTSDAKKAEPPPAKATPPAKKK